MSYFSYFPNTVYQLNRFDARYIAIKDILRRVKFTEYLNYTSGSSVPYSIKDEERPEDIAYKVYGRADLHWLILLFNEIHDPYFEWPMSSSKLEVYMEEKYPGIAIYLRKVDATIPEGADIYYTSDTSSGGTYTYLGKVHAWNPSLLKLEVSGSESILTSGFIRLNSPTTGTPISIFRSEINKYSINRFEDNYGQVLSPFASVSFPDQVGLPNEATPLITSYALSSATPEIAQLALDNYSYEQRRNDGKREIRLIQPDKIDSVTRVMRDALLR